jgi:hypothetical protein
MTVSTGAPSGRSPLAAGRPVVVEAGSQLGILHYPQHRPPEWPASAPLEGTGLCGKVATYAVYGPHFTAYIVCDACEALAEAAA